MHKRFLAAAVLVLAVANSTPTWAGWGCGFTGSDIKGNFGSIWGSGTEKEARATALRLCKKDHRGCYIVGCRNNVNTREDAMALWPMAGAAVRNCGRPGEEKC